MAGMATRLATELSLLLFELWIHSKLVSSTTENLLVALHYIFQGGDSGIAGTIKQSCRYSV